MFRDTESPLPQHVHSCSCTVADALTRLLYCLMEAKDSFWCPAHLHAMQRRTLCCASTNMQHACCTLRQLHSSAAGQYNSIICLCASGLRMIGAYAVLLSSSLRHSSNKATRLY